MPNFEESLKHMIRRMAGSTFWVKITVTSSHITTATKLALTGAATGDLALRDVILKTDSTGLAGGTNLQIGSTNAKGVSNILVETVANLGANVTKVLAPGVSHDDETTSPTDPTVTAAKTVLEGGANLWVNCTGGNCTGAGTMDLYFKFERILENNTVSALGQSV